MVVFNEDEETALLGVLRRYEAELRCQAPSMQRRRDLQEIRRLRDVLMLHTQPDEAMVEALEPPRRHCTLVQYPNVYRG